MRLKTISCYAIPTPILKLLCLHALRNNSKAIILNTRIMPSYNLLPDKNGSFDVKFDTVTPRPHFIILPKNQAGIKPDFSKMTLDQRKKLMKAARSMMASFDIRIYWCSVHSPRAVVVREPTKIFHAHFCVDVVPYLEVFKKEQHRIYKKNWLNI